MSEPGTGKGTRVVAVDTGGTFTDVLLLDGGRLRTLKVASTPADPAEAVLQGIRQILDDDEAFTLLHGSTVATNAVLERKGARVMLVTNSGFEDVIEIGRQSRPQLYALAGHRPPPLVSRADRTGIKGRLGPVGEEIEPLDPVELEALASRLTAADAVAIVLLHSYANPEHEERVASALAELGTLLSVSSRLLPEFREFERSSTAVVNAYVAPKMTAYLGRLDGESGAARFRVMGSNGGALSARRAREEPVHTILSGPAGGVVGALAWASRAGYDRIISFDMGGTSTDVSLCPGEPLQTREYQIDGQPVAIPVIDIHTVGAGGGSLARVDTGGALRVGPESAGADPGPICYGRGGEQVTVTDAHVWLNRLPVEAFLGGERSLDRGSVAGPLRALAAKLGLSSEDAAQGVIEIADSAMEGALRVISVARGFAASEFVLVAFGGAGGLHAAELAERLGTSGALIPPDPGLLSAYGMLAASVTQEASRTVLIKADDPKCTSVLSDAFEELDQNAIWSLTGEGIAEEAIDVRRWIDARYQGQSFELRIPADDWTAEFHRQHEVRYGYARRETAIEVVTLRSVASAPGPELRHETLAPTAKPQSVPTTVYVRGETLEARKVWRRELGSGSSVIGPALVLEYSSTTWVPDGWVVRCDEWGVLHLERI
jgi:N-methylhydantoinase A